MKKLNKITIKYLLNRGCCYSKDKLKKIFKKKQFFTLMEAANKRSVSVKDRIWVLLHPDFLGDDFYKVLKEIVDPMVAKHCLKCGVPETEKWAKEWLENDDWMQGGEAAGAAARAAGAAEAAAWAARAAAWAAAGAAEAAAEAAGAARAAAWAAAGVAAGAARAAEEKRQMRIIKRYLK